MNDYVDEQLEIGFENGLQVLEHAHSILNEMKDVWGAGGETHLGAWTETIDQRLLWYAAFLCDFRHFNVSPEAISEQQERQFIDRENNLEKIKQANSTSER